MFSSIMVPEGVRRLFQVLTGEDMTDADEGALFAVADALESGAVGLGEVRTLVAELVGKVRTEFSGKAADRFADGLEIFDGLLSSGQAGLLDLAVFVRKTSQQVRYLKLMTIYSLELLAVEMSWAMQFAGATAGATLAWLAARMAVMRFLLTSWWRQLFMRLAMMAAGGVVFNVLPDVQAQLQMWGEESAEKWDGTLTGQAAGMGAFSALVALPLSAVGGLVSNALTKVLVKGLGDDVDAAILEAAAKKAVAEHAGLYPVSAMAKFADAVGKSLDNYAGMQVGTMWLVKMGSGLGDAVAGSLSDFFGEVAYAAAAGLEVTWNPYSLSAGGFETVFSGVGTLAGLALRGKLHPQGPSPYLEGPGRGDGGSDDGGGSGEEKTPLPGAGSGSQTGHIPGPPDKDSTFIPSDASRSDASRSDASRSDGSRSDRWAGSDSGAGADSSSVSDVDSVFSDTGSVDSAAVPVPSGKDLVVSAVVDGKDSKDVQDGTDVKGGKEGAGGGGKGGADDGTPGEALARGVPVVPGSGQHRPGTPPPAYSGGVPGFGPDRPGTPPPPYSPSPGDDQTAPGKRPLEVSASKTPDSPTVTPHASDVPAATPSPEPGRPGSVVESGGRVSADAARPGTVGSGSVVGPHGRVPAGHPGSPGGVAGLDGAPGAASVAERGDSHRQDGPVVSPDSATLPEEGSQTAPSLHRDPVAVLPAETVRVPVTAEVVAGGRWAEFVRSGGVADSTGGPVLLVSDSDPDAGVVVTSRQGSALAQYLGRHVVAMMPGQAGREPRWTVFPADGSRPKPLAGPGAAVLAGGRSGGVAGLAEASVGVPAAPGTAPGAAPVGQWSDADVLEEIKRVRLLGLSSEEKDAVRLTVQRMHDPRKLAGWSAAVSPADPVSVDDVVTLVAARSGALGGDRGQVEAFSRELAERLGTVLAEGSSGLGIWAGAGPVGQAGRSGESAAGSGRHTSGGPSQSGAAAAVDDPAGGAGEQREPEGRKGRKGRTGTRGAASVGSRASKRRKAATTVAAGIDSGNQGGEGDGSAPTHQAEKDARIAERKRKKQEDNAKQLEAYKEAMARVAELKAERDKKRESGEELDSEEEEELAELEAKVEKRRQQWRKSSAELAQARKARKARVAELKAERERKRERGEELDSEEEKELAKLEPRVEKRQQQLRESGGRFNEKRTADNARVRQLTGKRERGEELDSEEEKELAERKLRVNKRQRQGRESKERNKKKARDEAARVAELENWEELWLLTPEEEGELDLRREIEAYTKKKNDLQKQARERNRAIADIKELEALPQSAEIKDRLERLREQVLGLPDVAESLKETKGRLAEKKEKLDGLGWIAGVGASGQQGEQDAMVLSGVSESAGAGREASPVGSDLGEWLAWANADLGVSGVAGSAESAGAGREASPDGGVEPFPEAVLEEDSAGVPAAPGAVPVGRWSDADVREEIKGARKLGLSSEEKDAVRLTVQSTHDPQKLRGAVSVDDVMALVAARGRGLDGDWGQVEAFSRELAERLGTVPAEGSSGLSIRAGAGPVGQAGRSGESAAGSGRHTSGGPSQSGAAAAVDDPIGDLLALSLQNPASGAGDQRGPEEQPAPTEVEIRDRIAAVQEALEWLEVQKAELEAVQGRDEDRQALRESERAFHAELAKFVPDGIAKLAELTARMERHLRTMPPEYNPNGVREKTEAAKNLVWQGPWTPAQVQKVEEELPGVEAAVRVLRDARRAKVHEVYMQAKQAKAQRRVPITYFKDGVPGGVSSRPDARLGLEVEFKLPGENFDERVNSLGAELEREELVDWRTAHGSKLLPWMEDYEEILLDGRWALQEEAERFEVEATSPILRNDPKRPVSEQLWPSMEKLLSAVQRQGGYGSESGGHINVSFDWSLTPRQYVRVAQVVKVFEALLFRLGNVAGGDESKQRKVRNAGPISLPSDPYAVDDDTGDDGHESLPDPTERFRAVRFDVLGYEDDRLEFRVWAGDAGELTRNPALWQVRAELSAAIMLAGTDPAIYRELDRLMGDPDLLGYDDQTRDEGVWLEKLVEFLELLPLSEAGQAQVVQLFAWTRPWKLGDLEEGHLALVVSLPQQSLLFPAPDASKVQVIAEAYSYQLYKDASLVVARMTSDRSGIPLPNGKVIDLRLFARLLQTYYLGYGSYSEETWTLLAIPRASGALLAEVLRSVKGPVLATMSDVYRTPDGRLLTGVYERLKDGHVRFRPAREGWIEFTKNKDDPSQIDSRSTGKADVGDALMESSTRLYDKPAEVYRYWPTRGSGS